MNLKPHFAAGNFTRSEQNWKDMNPRFLSQSKRRNPGESARNQSQISRGVAIPEAVVPVPVERQTAAPVTATKSRPETHVISAKSVAPREVIVLKPTLGILVLKRSPSLRRSAFKALQNLTAHAIAEDRLELLEGPYVLTVTAAGYAKATVPANIEAGKTREIALELQP